MWVLWVIFWHVRVNTTMREITHSHKNFQHSLIYSRFTLLIDHTSQYACVIKTYLVWLKDGGQARWWRVNMQTHQMLISPRDRPLTTHSSCYWHTEWEESVLSYKNIKNPTKACGCRLYFHVKRLLTYLKKLSCFTVKTPTTPFSL